ncbi:uncharacterized protein EV422DRAFT_30296 [Fimicolochytrium jonesii]|uniref:uncharacterized protein n=1 Tax=Fimicolochytrium jonesii TaxID=1396493 RepID=UPI0022FE01FC|nr:uncharacterized protein EV422DRAFT_30296 [Fimicolochytrium jonesii]KAI8827179.1 hypothetical protein EV422DRAFT_30296 [Fimicolochytrium jonesii]
MESVVPPPAESAEEIASHQPRLPTSVSRDSLIDSYTTDEGSIGAASDADDDDEDGEVDRELAEEWTEIEDTLRSLTSITANWRSTPSLGKTLKAAAATSNADRPNSPAVLGLSKSTTALPTPPRSPGSGSVSSVSKAAHNTDRDSITSGSTSTTRLSATLEELKAINARVRGINASHRLSDASSIASSAHTAFNGDDNDNSHVGHPLSHPTPLHHSQNHQHHQHPYNNAFKSPASPSIPEDQPMQVLRQIQIHQRSGSHSSEATATSLLEDIAKRGSAGTFGSFTRKFKAGPGMARESSARGSGGVSIVSSGHSHTGAARVSSTSSASTGHTCRNSREMSGALGDQPRQLAANHRRTGSYSTANEHAVLHTAAPPSASSEGRSGPPNIPLPSPAPAPAAPSEINSSTRLSSTDKAPSQRELPPPTPMPTTPADQPASTGITRRNTTTTSTQPQRTHHRTASTFSASYTPVMDLITTALPALDTRYSGYLHATKTKPGAFFRFWKRRYCVLTPQSAYIYREQPSPSAMMVVTTGANHTASASGKGKDSQPPRYVLLINTKAELRITTRDGPGGARKKTEVGFSLRSIIPGPANKEKTMYFSTDDLGWIHAVEGILAEMRESAKVPPVPRVRDSVRSTVSNATIVPAKVAPPLPSPTTTNSNNNTAVNAPATTPSQTSYPRSILRTQSSSAARRAAHDSATSLSTVASTVTDASRPFSASTQSLQSPLQPPQHHQQQQHSIYALPNRSNYSAPALPLQNQHPTHLNRILSPQPIEPVPVARRRGNSIHHSAHLDPSAYGRRASQTSTVSDASAMQEERRGSTATTNTYVNPPHDINTGLRPMGQYVGTAHAQSTPHLPGGYHRGSSNVNGSVGQRGQLQLTRAPSDASGMRSRRRDTPVVGWRVAEGYGAMPGMPNPSDVPISSGVNGTGEQGERTLRQAKSATDLYRGRPSWERVGGMMPPMPGRDGQQGDRQGRRGGVAVFD